MRHEWLWKRWLIGRDWIGADDAIDRRRRRRDAFDVTGDAAAHVGAATLHLGPPRRRHSSSYYFPTKKKKKPPPPRAITKEKRKSVQWLKPERERRRKTVGATIKAESEVVHDERRALFDAIDPASTTQSRKRRRRSIEQQQSHPVQRERERDQRWTELPLIVEESNAIADENIQSTSFLWFLLAVRSSVFFYFYLYLLIDFFYSTASISKPPTRDAICLKKILITLYFFLLLLRYFLGFFFRLHLGIFISAASPFRSPVRWTPFTKK